MPRKTDKIAIKCPFMDKRTKLLPCQIERMTDLHENGASLRQLAKMFNVSKRTVQFKLDPKKLKENLKRRAERGGWEQYYDKEDHRKYQKAHRDNKKELFTGKSHIKPTMK